MSRRGKQNLVSSGTTDRLIENYYLHSNTNNFVQNVNTMSKMSNYGKLNKEFKGLRARLVKLINETNKQMNLFYEDFKDENGNPLIKGRDKFSGAKNNPIYSPEGAREFSRKYLLNRNNELDAENSTDEKILLGIVNSQDTINFLQLKAKEIADDNSKLTFTNEQKTLIHNLDTVFNHKISRKIKNSTGQSIQDAIDSLTGQSIQNVINSLFIDKRDETGKGKLRFAIKKGNYKKNYFDENTTFKQILKEIEIEEFSPTNKNNLSEFKAAVLRKLYSDAFYSKLGSIFWDYINEKFKEKTGKKLAGPKKRRFVSYFTNTIKNYKGLSLFDANQTSGLKGFVLEFGVAFAFNMPRKYGNDIVNIIGQKMVIREYLLEEKTKQKSIINTKSFSGESASDIEFIGASGQVYRFQLKNNFNSISDALSFRTQASIKVSTFIPTALDGYDKDVKDTLAYLLINTAFLRENGLDKYKQGNQKDKKFQPSKFPVVAQYINLFLQMSYEFLIGYKYSANLKETEAITAGNLAYIFQGRYLIPVASFFYSSLQMLDNVIKQTEMKGIGGIHGIPSFKNVELKGFNESSISKEDFQEKKINLLSKMGSARKGTYKYPEPLVEFGSDYGKDLYNSLFFERISIVLKIGQLEKFFK